ncbi:ATP-binding protein [Lentzea sp. NPDC055074]
MDEVHNEVSGPMNGSVIQAGTVHFGAPSRPAAVAGLPAQPVFVGRQHELDQLVDALRPREDPAPVLVCALGGLPGVGKTALAIRTARLAEGSGWFPGGVVMIDLYGYDGPEKRVPPVAALASLLGALGVPAEHVPDGLDDRMRLWRTLLAKREQPMLVIADNASSSEQVRPLLPGTGTHRVLITSRDRLADLDGVRVLSIDALEKAEAVRMLAETVAAGDPGEDRVGHEQAAAERIVSLCGGLPLAIRVVAALLVADPDRSLTELAEELADDRERLRVLDYDGNLAVRTAFDLSYGKLDAEHARLFGLIGLHPGPTPTMEVMAALADRSVAQTRTLVRGLARAHLVLPAAVRGCWRMHDLIRNYAAEKGEQEPDRLPALRRMIAHYTETCVRLGTWIERGTGESSPHFSSLIEALRWASRELDNLIASVRLAAEVGELATLVRLVISLDVYFTILRPGSELAVLNELALKAARDIGDRRMEGRVLKEIGLFHRRQGRLDEAFVSLEESLVVLREVGAREEEARALTNLGNVLHQLGRHEESITVVQRALREARELDLPDVQGSALHNLGVAHRLSGRPQEALAFHLEDLQICREVTGNYIGVGRVLDVLGLTYQALEDFSAAADHHEQCIEMFRALGGGVDLGRGLRNLGCTLRRLGRLPEAITRLEEAVGVFEDVQHLAELATTLQELGTTQLAAGNEVEAARCWEEALDALARVSGTGRAAQAESIRDALSALPSAAERRTRAEREPGPRTP